MQHLQCLGMNFKKLLIICSLSVCGLGGVVGIATGYGLDGLGIESWWVRDFPHLSGSALYNGYRFFPGGKERLGRDADPSPLLVPWSRKSRATPLLPLWAIKPVQSLSACTRVHFTFTFSSATRPVRALKEVISKTCCNTWQVILIDTDCYFRLYEGFPLSAGCSAQYLFNSQILTHKK